MKFSRRYYCRNCGHKGRVSKDKRAAYISCVNCEKLVKLNIIKEKVQPDEGFIAEESCIIPQWNEN